MKHFGAELAEQIVKHFQSDEIRKLLDETKAASDSDTGTFEAIITTENLDRYQEVIKLDGWQLEHYRNNPVVLWGHDHNQPIGMATSIEIIDGKMIAKGKFAPTETAQEIRKLYDFGIIKATSVGFIEKEREGNLITKAELLEFSFVSVPANPFALSLAMEKGLGINDLVTKGMLFLEREVSAEVTTIPTDEGLGKEIVQGIGEIIEGIEPQGKDLGAKQLSPVIDSLKAAVVALEALGTKAEEPEGDEDPSSEDDAETKTFKEFSEKRRVLQHASSIIGDVLAEARQAIDVKKAG